MALSEVKVDKPSFRAYIDYPFQGLFVAEEETEEKARSMGLWKAKLLFPDSTYIPDDVYVIQSAVDGIKRVIGKYRIGD